MNVDVRQKTNKLRLQINSVDNEIIATIHHMDVKFGKRTLTEKVKFKYFLDQTIIHPATAYPYISDCFFDNFYIMFLFHFRIDQQISGVFMNTDLMKRIFYLLNQRFGLMFDMYKLNRSQSSGVWRKSCKEFVMRKWLEDDNAVLGHCFLYAMLDNILSEADNNCMFNSVNFKNAR